MYKSILMMLLGCISLTGCGGRVPAKQEKVAPEVVKESSLVDLDESTQIIVELLRRNELSTILEDASEKELSLFVNNFSPAEMAFEAEVLNAPLPVAVFYAAHEAQARQIVAEYEELAQRYEYRIKFVVILADKLFNLTEKAEIDTFPAVLIIHNRQEIGRLEGDLEVNSVSNLLNASM